MQLSTLTLPLLLSALALLSLPPQVVTAHECLHSLPEFRNTEHLPRDGLDNGIAAVIPDYTFNCTGLVSQWSAHVERRRNRYDRYDITFYVWRRSSSSEGDCDYVLVGQNTRIDLAPELGENVTVLGTVRMNIDADEQILVHPGDFIGFTVQHFEVLYPSGERIQPGAASVMVDLDRSDVEVWQRQLPLPEPACLRERDFDTNAVPYAGVFQPSPVLAAPVINVQLDIVALSPSPTPTQELTSTSSSPSSSSSSSSPSTTSTSSSDPSSTPSISTPSSSTSSMDMSVLLPVSVAVTILVVVLVTVLLILLIIFCCLRKSNKEEKSTSPVESELVENSMYRCRNDSAFSDTSTLHTLDSSLCLFPEERPPARHLSNAMYAPLNSTAQSVKEERALNKKDSPYYSEPKDPAGYSQPRSPVYNMVGPHPHRAHAYLSVYKTLSHSPPPEPKAYDTPRDNQSVTRPCPLYDNPTESIKSRSASTLSLSILTSPPATDVFSPPTTDVFSPQYSILDNGYKRVRLDKGPDNIVYDEPFELFDGGQMEVLEEEESDTDLKNQENGTKAGYEDMASLKLGSSLPGNSSILSV